MARLTGRPGRALALALTLGIGAASAAPVSAQTAADTPGANVGELIAMARRLNPELAARALETDAAAAKASGAGSLDDPTFRITSDEVDRTSGSRINKMIYSVEQEFPLWGKREIRQAIAQAEATGARGRERASTVELDARIKIAFAQYWRASRAIEVTHSLHELLHAVAQTAQTRYAQGIGQQSDAIRSGVEQTQLDLEYSTLDRDKRAAQGRINALLARPPGSVLADPTALRPMPSPQVLRIDDLLRRARESNPILASANADIAAAEGGRKLVAKSWYPDVTLGVGAIDRADGPPGYMASIGIKVPLQWGFRDAQARETSARASAARSQLDAQLLDLQGTLEEALSGLDAVKRSKMLLTTTLKPQTEAAYRSALTSYQLGRGDLTAALESAHRVEEVQLELLKAQAEEQVLLAQIERTIGGDL
jgi:outer membrane protein TolC